MRKELWILAIICLLGTTVVFAQVSPQGQGPSLNVVCNSKSTIQQCQDKINIDNLNIQIIAAQSKVQQDQQGVIDLQKQVQSNAIDYLTIQQQQTILSDTATLADLQKNQVVP